MKVTITGRVKQLGHLQKFDSGFQKKEIVITPNPEGDYPDHFPVELLKDKADAMDAVKPGTLVEMDCYLGGRQYNGRFYLSLKYASHRVTDPVQDAPAPVQPAAPAPAASDEGLPF